MKKFYFEMRHGLWCLTMLLGLICCFSLSSCGDDDDEPGTEQNDDRPDNSNED